MNDLIRVDMKLPSLLEEDHLFRHREEKRVVDGGHLEVAHKERLVTAIFPSFLSARQRRSSIE